MRPRRPPRPTDAELAILRVLWERGPSTVRDIHEAMSDRQTTVYTTTLKFLQIMFEKGLVERDDSRRTHVYAPRLREEETQRQLVGDLLERAFGGSAEKLVLQALSAKGIAAEDLARIRQLLDEIEGGRR